MAKKILIVDDESDVLKVTEFRVRKAGYETVTASDGAEGLKKIKEEKPDMVLLDYKLPEMNGVEVYLKAKEDDAIKDIPIVFLTASKANEDLITKMEEIGAEHSLIKPFDPEKLMAKIKEIVGE